MTLRLFDTHCHLDDPAYDKDRREVVARAWEAGLIGAVCVGCDLASSRSAIELADRTPGLAATVGLHPHEAEKAGNLERVVDELRSLAAHPKVVAIGEAGLDYHYDFSPRPIQREAFRLQAALALELGLPLVVHDRDAHADTLAILKKTYGKGERRPDSTTPPGEDPGRPKSPPIRPGIMHCFSGDADMARTCLELGFYISFAGPLTYPKAEVLRGVATIVPPAKLLIETDSPYLPPQGRRGKRNEPAYVAEVAVALAMACGVSPAQAAERTTSNALSVFGLA